jgi:xylulokinase
MALYLGLDCSTQSLTAIVIDVAGSLRRVVFETSLDFDRELPAYGTRSGVLPVPDMHVAETPPLMWVEALDRVMARVAGAAGLDLQDLRAISGSGQQHGSVYLDRSFTAVLAGLDPARPLQTQLDGVFARPHAPTWMDSSTSVQCSAIERGIGGPEALARLTGSRAFERFTGPQIRKFAETDPAAYARTERIHLVSSFLASLLIGRHAPIDHADASGMNLMDLTRRVWAPEAVDATAPDLARRLPDLVPSWTVVGRLAPYWVRRYGLPPAAVVACSGDNPCSLIGIGIIRPGIVGVSLGTSDTVFGYVTEPRVDPAGTSHTFVAPTGDYMSLICFENGALARRRVGDAFGLDWDAFSRALAATPPGNGGGLMLPWFGPEITPHVVTPGVRRDGLSPTDGPANVRAVVEAQMMSMANHSGWMGERVQTIHATGGAARDREILQVMADVFDAEVVQLQVGNSACLGAALRACHAEAVSRGQAVGWDAVVDGFVRPVARRRVAPVPGRPPMYRELRARYAAFEARALASGD